jgi:hypothetical protein
VINQQPVTQPAPVQEPIAYCDPSDPFSATAFSWPGTERNPLHTMALTAAPPAVPLTDEQIVSMRDNHPWLTERDRPAYLRGVYDAELFHRITKGQP